MASCLYSRELEQQYNSLLFGSVRVISANTGCKKPCKYKKYTLVGEPNPMPPIYASTGGFGILAAANDTTVGLIT